MRINHLITPFKLQKPVLEGSGIEGMFDSRAVDCCYPFRHHDKFYMTYIGFDGVGYQTGMAISEDLVHWEPQGIILKRGSNLAWDQVGMAATWILRDNDLYGEQTLKKVNGKYWMFYHAYPREGYEAGGAEIGVAYTDDESLMSWTFVGNPVLSYRDGDPWERGGLYKCCVLEHEGKYFMYYNAKNGDGEGGWLEQTGMATSTDMLHWHRYHGNPVLPVTRGAWDETFASDPWVAYDSREKQWVMFYYGYNGKQAMDGIAVSKDLYNWRKFPAPILTTGAGKDIDTRYAHKPGIFYHNNMLYHFYCACRPYREGDRAKNFSDEYRCISVARSHPWY